MKKLTLLITILILAVTLTACGESSSELTDTEWQFTKITSGSQELIENPENYILVFNDDGTFSANVNCNLVSGTYQVHEDELTMTPDDYSLSDCGSDKVDDGFLNFLKIVESHKLDGDKLTLYLTDGITRIGFEKE
jgi:heat shock protein HslJ